MKKYDRFGLGIGLGILIPTLCMLSYYWAKFFPLYSFGQFIQYSARNTPALTPLIALSLLLNMVLFTVFVNTSRYKSGKGLFWATVAYGLLSFIFKLLA